MHGILPAPYIVVQVQWGSTEGLPAYPLRTTREQP